jgi:hypothetical protein
MFVTLRLAGTLATAAALVLPAGRTRAGGARDVAADTLRVVLVVGDTLSPQALLEGALASLVRGARLGAEEAAHTGALFGVAVTLRVEVPSSLAGMPRANDSAASRLPNPSLYVVAGDAQTCSRIMSQGARDSVPVLDAGCPSHDGTNIGNVYSLTATATVPVDDSTRLELWHWSLDRFGGEQLNQRFVRRFGARMDSRAWIGWMAMKIALDAALHAKATDGAALLRQLADPQAQYDGQKGRPLRFAPDTHRLVQPQYRVAGRGAAEHVVAEVAP